MLPRDNRRQTGGRGGRTGKPERSSSRQSVQPGRGPGNAPVIIGFSPPATATATVPNDRLLFAFQVLIGYTVEVQVKSGALYQGIFHTAQLDNGELHIVLQMAKLTRDSEQNLPDGTAARTPIKELIIKSADFVALHAKGVRMGEADLSGLADDSFSTDTAISRGRGGLAGRELQRWAPEASDDLTGMLLESEPAQKGKASGRWDQFAANQQLFGTATSYNEDLYTTKLDAGASGISVQEAERLAAEIQSGTTSNRHVAEERGAHVNDSGMDEEDLYSAVGRQAHAAEPDEQESGLEDDSMNADTFGPASLAAANNGTGPSRPAWSSAGASVALVAGSNRGEGQDQATSSRSAASQPIDMSMRAEHNKVRTHLAGPKKDRSSPYGTPAAKSPLSSPLIADAAALEALNLNPGSAKFDTGTLKSFQEYKLQEAARRAAQGRSPRISPSAISMSPSETSILDQTDPLREEDSDLFAAAATPRKVSPGSTTSSAAAETPVSVSAPAAPPPASPATDTDAAAAAAAAAAAPSARTSAGAGDPAAARAEPAETSGNAMSNSSGKAAQGQAQAAPSSKLNPFAQEFKLNVNAPSFTPVSKPAQPQGSAASAGRTGQGAGPGPASAPSLPPPPHSTGPPPGPRPNASSHSGSQASAEERQSRPGSASQGQSQGGPGPPPRPYSQGRPGSSPQGRPGGGHVGRPYMPPDYMWPQSEGMHMPGPRPNGPMAMQNMAVSGPYMMPGVMPGMMPGMQMMGTGSPEQMMGYMQNSMRPYSQPVGYGMMAAPYGMMYGHQMSQPAPGARPPMYSQGYQGPAHLHMQQGPINQMPGSVERQSSAGAAHGQQSNANKRQ